MPQNLARELPAEHHVWAPDDDGVRDAPFDRLGHALLREMRGRQPPRERGRLGAALVIAILLHILLILVLRVIMRPQYLPPAPAVYGQPISVSLYESPYQPVAAQPVPEINLPPLRTRESSPRRVRIQSRAPNSMTATIGETQPSAPHLYGRNGQALLPPPPSAVATSDYAAPVPKSPALMKHTTPVPYHSTRFNNDWAPDGESLGSKAFRKAVDATTVEKTVHLPGGIKLHCGASLLLIAVGGVGCSGDTPPPPPKNDDDIRLSMPPALSLTGKKVTVPAKTSTSALPAKAATHAPVPASSSP